MRITRRLSSTRTANLCPSVPLRGRSAYPNCQYMPITLLFPNRCSGSTRIYVGDTVWSVSED